MVQTSPGVPGCPQHPSAVPSLPVAQLSRLERELSLPGAGLPGLAGGPRDHLVPALRMCPCETYLCLLLASPAHRHARQGIGLGSPGRAPSALPPHRQPCSPSLSSREAGGPPGGLPREAPGFLAARQLCGWPRVRRSYCWGSTVCSMQGPCYSLLPGRTLGSANYMSYIPPA